MDVWVEFKNASRWQAEALFRNFFPCEDDDEILDIEGHDLDSIQFEDNIEVQELIRPDDQQESKPRVYKPVDPLSMLKKDEKESIPLDTSLSSSSSSSATPPTLWSLATSASSLLNSVSTSSSTSEPPPPLPKTYSGSPIVSPSPSQSQPISSKLDKSQFGATNTAYLPPPPDASITAKSKTKPLDRKTLAVLAKKFADGVPEEEFSVAGLQGCELTPFGLNGIFTKYFCSQIY
jgi:mitochondrial chaperone BCS1